MINTYQKHVESGDITSKQAQAMGAARQRARVQARVSIVAAGAMKEPVAFGMLDTIAVELTRWYGADRAAEVLRHYASVCAGQEKKGAANGG